MVKSKMGMTDKSYRIHFGQSRKYSRIWQTIEVAHFLLQLFTLCVSHYVYMCSYMHEQFLWKSETVCRSHFCPSTIPSRGLNSSSQVWQKVLRHLEGQRRQDFEHFTKCRKSNRRVAQWCNLRICKTEQKNEEFKPRLGYIRPCLTKHPPM